MPYAYCEKCDRPLAAPTIIEVLLDRHECPDCETERPVSIYDKKDTLEGLLARIERLESCARAGVPLPPAEV